MRKKSIAYAKTFKLKALLTYSTGAGSTFTGKIQVTNPADIDGSGTILEDLNNLATLYDQFRVTGVKLQWYPSAPNDQSSVTNYLPVYVVHDWDTTTNPASLATLIQYDNLKVKNLFVPWKIWQRIPQLSKFNSGSVSLGRGWMDVADIGTATNTGAIWIFAEGLTVGKVYGRLLVTYYIKFKNRR